MKSSDKVAKKSVKIQSQDNIGADNSASGRAHKVRQGREEQGKGSEPQDKVTEPRILRLWGKK